MQTGPSGLRVWPHGPHPVWNGAKDLTTRKKKHYEAEVEGNCVDRKKRSFHISPQWSHTHCTCDLVSQGWCGKRHPLLGSGEICVPHSTHQHAEHKSTYRVCTMNTQGYPSRCTAFSTTYLALRCFARKRNWLDPAMHCLLFTRMSSHSSLKPFNSELFCFLSGSSSFFVVRNTICTPRERAGKECIWGLCLTPGQTLSERLVNVAVQMRYYLQIYGKIVHMAVALGDVFLVISDNSHFVGRAIEFSVCMHWNIPCREEFVE